VRGVRPAWWRSLPALLGLSTAGDRRHLADRRRVACPRLTGSAGPDVAVRPRWPVASPWGCQRRLRGTRRLPTGVPRRLRRGGFPAAARSSGGGAVVRRRLSPPRQAVVGGTAEGLSIMVVSTRSASRGLGEFLAVLEQRLAALPTDELRAAIVVHAERLSPGIGGVPRDLPCSPSRACRRRPVHARPAAPTARASWPISTRSSSGSARACSSRAGDGTTCTRSAYRTHWVCPALAEAKHARQRTGVRSQA
jgi:hypothetical protein